MVLRRAPLASTQSTPQTIPAESSPIPQRTIARDVTVDGIGFVTGADVTVRFRPAPPNTGIEFVRVDLPGQPKVPANIEHLVRRRRRTTLQANGATVEMTEHVLAALVGMGIDNCTVEMNAGETPGMDGSALPYVEALAQAGAQELDAFRSMPVSVDAPLCINDGESMVAIHPGPADRLEVTFNLDYGSAPGVGRQCLSYRLTPETFRTEIAPARTFVLLPEVEALRQQGIGLRSTAKDLLVFGADGKPIDNELRFADECVRHKILDVIGDFALLGRPLSGHILAHKSGHHHNTGLVRKLTRFLMRRAQTQMLESKPLLDVTQIEKIIPHRYPFLLVDRVLELDPHRRAVGIKNVSANEPFFQGHWPGRPIMPGVLVVESMAQLAGLMLTQWQEQGQYPMILSMNGIKLRRAVVPGDQLWMEAVAVRVKERTAVLKTRAFVNQELAAEAQLRFVLLDDQEVI